MADEIDRVGARLRAARQAKGLTLEEVAGRAGMSVSTLSRLESGKRQASLALLVPVTRQLGIRLDDLVRPDSPDPRVRRPAIRRNGLVIAPLAPQDSPIHTYKITYPPVAELPELKVHDGFEWLYVLRGKLRLRLGEQDLILGRGEAAEFDTRTPHAMCAAGSRPAEVLSIFNADGVRMHTHGAAADEDGEE
ncbi:XRE family transcriptional regulator [Microbacterium sp. CFBP9034]|uniref:helix-turn-helix domain-containing protein n=1 Tax=Microbacterium sp. CFBP9034 TaxID=3096540 RepID=UPI002A6A1787|nr:XRE family transcriptional regulator [Microbacterium sp. CFBP9034]MDY0910686.1 XRE family transcriptional regulator [Microbacterium sp. CFBP9034]